MREAARLGVSLTTGAADLRALDTAPGAYDLVISCDNALQRHELTAILRNVGFQAVHWYEPADSGYYQPIVTPRR